MNNNTAEGVRELQVVREFHSVSNAINITSDLVSDLKSRLSSVLGHEPTNPIGKDAQKQVLVPFASDLANLSNIVDNTNAALISILDRLEI